MFSQLSMLGSSVAIPQGTNRFASRLKNTSSLTAAAHSISAR